MLVEEGERLLSMGVIVGRVQINGDALRPPFNVARWWAMTMVARTYLKIA